LTARVRVFAVTPVTGGGQVISTGPDPFAGHEPTLPLTVAASAPLNRTVGLWRFGTRVFVLAPPPGFVSPGLHVQRVDVQLRDGQFRLGTDHDARARRAPLRRALRDLELCGRRPWVRGGLGDRILITPCRMLQLLIAERTVRVRW
ncbi:MAG TPA: hypothetical protein VF916_07810, partial [Ktedonobacterales bacterium]